MSPFMPIDVDYDWRFSTPGSALAVHMIRRRGGQELFDATIQKVMHARRHCRRDR